jgi:hypothetical protein
MSSEVTLQRPTFQGYVETPFDALLILEATLIGILQPIVKRLNTQERIQIKSGDVYVYEERRSGIKRWTEGRVWTPSRILGHFLIYRETEKEFKKGQKKDGMIKKTISFKLPVHGNEDTPDQWHIVSYYSECDLEFGILDTPSNVPELKNLKPREEIEMFPLGRTKNTQEQGIEFPLRQSTSINSATTNNSILNPEPIVDAIASPWTIFNTSQESFIPMPFYLHPNDPNFEWTPTPDIDVLLDQFMPNGSPTQLYCINGFMNQAAMHNPNVSFDPPLFTADPDNADLPNHS